MEHSWEISSEMYKSQMRALVLGSFKMQYKLPWDVKGVSYTKQMCQRAFP